MYHNVYKLWTNYLLDGIAWTYKDGRWEEEPYPSCGTSWKWGVCLHSFCNGDKKTWDESKIIEMDQFV